MQNLKMITAGFLFLLLLWGCGLKEGVVQNDNRSYLWFTGNTESAMVSIDDLKPFSLKINDPQQKTSKDLHYEVLPGKHTIVITRDGQVVVNRIVLLGEGIIKEIRIP